MQFNSTLTANHENNDKTAEKIYQKHEKQGTTISQQNPDFCIDISNLWLYWIQESQITIKTLNKDAVTFILNKMS